MCLNYTFTFSFIRFLISPLFCSQNSPIYPRIDFLADFWSFHLRNEFTWCYANPTISYSYISMNDCRSWSRLSFPLVSETGSYTGFLISLCLLVSGERVHSAGQTCHRVTVFTCWAISPALFTSLLLIWWGQWLPAAIWNVFQMNTQTPWALTTEQLSCVWILGGRREAGKKMASGAKMTAESEALTGSNQNPVSPWVKNKCRMQTELGKFSTHISLLKVTILITHSW